MSNFKNFVFSAIPDGQERQFDPRKRVNFLPMIELLTRILTPALCQTVFDQFRDTQRERKWTFQAIARFWTAMIIDNPPSLQNGLDQTRKGRGKSKLWPRVISSPQSFFQKSSALKPELFKQLYDAFTAQILPQTRPLYASWVQNLRENFPDILVVDGSRLDAVAHRLKLLRRQDWTVLPGCVTVFYDLFRGITRQVWFYPDAAEAEVPRSKNAFEFIAAGTLILGDRLYAGVQYFHSLAQHNLYGLFRRHGSLKIKTLEIISVQRLGRFFLEDSIVEVGSGLEYPKLRLRLIRYKDSQRRLDLLSSVLDVKKLSAQQALELYGLRWTVERLFLELKETLNLHGLYSSHPSLVAQQVYASAIVHSAFRTSQAMIAKQCKILPEQVSPGKLFPKLAQASRDYCVLNWSMLETQALNPGTKIKFPNFSHYPSSYARLSSILCKKRTSKRYKKKFKTSTRKRWKSIAHFPGGKAFLKSLTVH